MKKVMLAIGKLTGGGAERVATVWANELAASGCSVSILASFRSDDEYEIRKDVTVYRIAESRKDFARLSSFKRLSTIRKMIRNEKPDYIISFLPHVQTWIMIAAFGLGVKRIETIRNNPWKENFPNALRRMLWKLCYHSCFGIILQSSEQAPFLTKRQQKKCAVIPNPIADVYLHSFKEEISSSPRRFAAAGRIHAQKNYPMMIKGFAAVCRKHPYLTLSIYGTGEQKYVEFIRNLIASEGMNDHIHLKGRVSNLDQEFHCQDVFLMTSDYEGMPNALAEAMASKLICISTDCKTGPGDLIDDGINGFLIPVSGEKALQQKIEHVLGLSGEELAQIAANARDKILTYCSKENSAQRVLDMLK